MATPTLDVYLTFDGTCAEAMRFYEKTLGGTMQAMMTFAQAPDMCPDLPPGHEDRSMHACVMLGDRALMASDSFPGQPYNGQHGVAVTLTYATVDEAKHAFAALSEGGVEQMPMNETFWSKAFGACQDKFGTNWLVNGEMKPF